MSERLVVLSTLPGTADAEPLARALVERRLAACVNVVRGLASYYRWKGVVQKDEEMLLVIKTRRACFPELRAALVELHPYDVPEVIALEVVDGHAPYLAWIDDCVRGEA